MCGISGILQNKGGNSKKLEETVKKMNDFQKNRGPDDEGIFINLVTNNSITIVLGHRRLSILDLSSAGHQPMIWQNGSILRVSDVPNIGGNFRTSDVQTLVITYNGEIYNFKELKKELESKGYKFKTQTDTEVILALYIEYGEKSFEMLRGMFAFAIWDGRNKKLFLVKDRYGIKPLYYYSDKEKLIFASTVGAIEESGLAQLTKNQKALTSFLLFGSVNLPMTTYKEISAIEPGHYLERDINGNEKLKKYYDPLKYFLNKSSDNFNLAKEKISKLLNDSVEKHLISDAPLGVFLSGGLDSSTIAALAANNRGRSDFQKLVTLSIIFDEPEFSEEYYSDLVAKKINSDHRKIKITKQDFYDSFDEVFKAMDQPTIDGVNTFFIAKAAKQAGLKTVLSGLGGDEIFLGYPHFHRAELLRKIQKMPKFLKLPINLLTNLLGGRYSKLSYFANDDILSFYLGIRGLFSPMEVAKILDINLSEVENFIEELNNSITNNLITDLLPADLLSYLELKFYLQNQLLKDTDFMSMHHSVEVRVPFLDHPLVEYLSSLPSEAKVNSYSVTKLLSLASNNLIINNSITKVNKPLLVAAVRDLLPQEIFTRPKMGFTFPFGKWLREGVNSYSINKLLGRPNSFIANNLTTKTHWSRFWATIILNRYL